MHPVVDFVLLRGDATLFAKKLLLEIENIFQDEGSWSKLLKKISQISTKLLQTFRVTIEKEYFVTSYLTHSFPMHPFSIPWKHYGFLMFSGVRERVQGALEANGLRKTYLYLDSANLNLVYHIVPFFGALSKTIVKRGKF